MVSATGISSITGLVSITGGTLTYDSDAVTFFTASGITDSTQKSAINQLVLDLKAASIWTKMKAIYPIVGGTSSTHAVNLKLPGTFDLGFTGGWTHSTTGALPNGTSAYANTGFAPSSNLTNTSVHLSYYSRTNSAGLNRYEMGCLDGTNEYSIVAKWSDGNFYPAINNGVSYPASAVSDTLGLFTATRTDGTTIRGYKNSTEIVNAAQATGTIAVSVYIGAFHTTIGGADGPDGYGSRECAFSSIGDGLNSTEAGNLYTAVQAYQTTLSRNV